MERPQLIMSKAGVNTIKYAAAVIDAVNPESIDFRLMGQEVQKIVFDLIKGIFDGESVKYSSKAKVKINNKFFKIYKQYKLEFKEKIKALPLEHLQTCKTVMAYSLSASDPVKNREEISTEKLVLKIRNELKEIVATMVRKKQQGVQLDCEGRSCSGCWDLTCG